MALAQTGTARLSFPLRSAMRWATLGLAVSLAAASWVVSDSAVPSGLLAPCLVGALMLSNYVSLPVGRQARIWFFNVPAFLIAALFAPPIAMALTGVGIGAKEVLACRRCRNSASQVAGQTGRWMFLALLGATVAHTGDVLISGLLLCAVLWIGDVVTAPLVISLGSLTTTIKRLFAQTWADETMQYVTAYFMLPFFVNQGGGLLLIAMAVLLNVTWLGLYITLRREVTAVATERKPAPASGY